MNRPWSAEQREWLQTLGYDLLARTPQAPDPAQVPDIRMPAMPSAARPMEQARPADHAAAVADPLLRALLRAARTETFDELHAVTGDLARLRADPAAKRAAWPRLRALRAGRRR